MKWNCENKVVTSDVIKMIETELKIKFPKDFIKNIKQYDGGYPIPNKISIEGQEEVLNNLVSFLEEDTSFILDIISNTENFRDSNLVPIAEDPFGNLFCYSFGENTCKIVFWHHEKNAEIKYVCNNFEELIAMLHE
ncbi:MAG: SMI1/KNR4 family protein [Lachnospiraceae bacterium]|nr:SMI1/KNR4 family protein [Lachnospiraceae bacterium]